MLNFPLPYQNELIYSTIARTGVRFGLTSPKQLLDVVYGNRKVIATIDLPNHLAKVAELLPQPTYTPELLIYKCTLFPLYAPFTTEDRRQQCIKWMGAASQGAVHLMLGLAASRLSTPRYIRFCPTCLKEQLKHMGEIFWDRRWQISGLDFCLLHGPLCNSKFKYRSEHRHTFHLHMPELPDYQAQLILPTRWG